MRPDRATVQWLLLFAAVLAAGLAGLVYLHSAEADSPSLSLRICRARVEPCQREVSIPTNGTVMLDLIIGAPGLPPGGAPWQIVAWETHFRLGDTRVTTLAPDPATGRPVQEQGDPDLVLAGLVPLEASNGEDQGLFFTIQNQFDGRSGDLDYSVTLARFDPSRPGRRVMPLAHDPLHLGRVMFQGLSNGTSTILPGHVTGNPFQVVTAEQPGRLSLVAVAPEAAPSAVIKVGAVPTPTLHGQILPPGLVDANGTGQPPVTLTVTFWRSGAVPAWRGGSDFPLATFREVATDATGQFNITDLSPSLIPPGIYDLRVDSRRTLPRLVQGVTVPAAARPGGPAPVALISLKSPPDGDIDGNNQIDQGDLTALTASFGRLAVEPEFNSNADFNGDSWVDVLDFARLARNFGQAGD